VASRKGTLRSGHRPLLAHYTVTVRAGGAVRKEQCTTLEGALAAIEREGRELERGADGRPEGGTLIRRLEPV
jgi:hypothetical protein